MSSAGAFTRSTVGTYFDSAGVLQTAAIDTPRFTYDPVTLEYVGLLNEVSATNSLRNNTMVGASAGSPGTYPTNWGGDGNFNSLTRTVVGTGTEDGISYIDIRYNGTASAGTTGNALFEATTQVAALLGQVWASSLYVRLVGGTLNGVTFANSVVERSGAGANLASSATAFIPSVAALRTQRAVHTRTFTDASTAYTTSQLNIIPTNGAAIDFTLRIGMPQLERTEVTTVIATSTVAVTRAADVNGMGMLSNVPETDALAHSLTTPYVLGEEVISNHKVYESLVGTSATVLIGSSSPANVTWTDHGLVADDPVVFRTTGTLPPPLVADTIYYVTATLITSNSFRISATPGGADINTTAGSGTHTGWHALNFNKDPATNPTVWLDTGATNRWSMFDQVVQSQTVLAGTIDALKARSA